MAKNTEHVQHVKSNVVLENGQPKLPTASVLVEGELAINYAEGYETISFKNSNNGIVRFSSDDYYTEQKLGSGFTGANSAKTVTEVIDNLDLGNEVEISSGETPTEETIELWVDTSVNPITVEVYTKAETDSMLLTKVNTSDVVQTINSETSASTNPVATSAVYNFVTAHTPTIEIDQVIDSGTSASTNAVATKAVYDAITDNELVWTNAYVAMSGAVSAHTANAEIHVTAADKTAWNAKADISDIPSVSGYADSVKYNSTSHYVEFYHGTTAGTKVFEYDASPFIIDGMVDDVRIENGNLVIDFNTASGKQDISIPLTDIFDPSNYYNKTAIDNLVGSGFTSSSITDVIIENEEIVSAALTDLDERKLDVTAYTPTDLSDYYTSAQTEAAISSAVSGKNDTSAFTAHTADTTVHITSGERTTWNGKANAATTLSGYGITDAYTKTEIDTMIGNIESILATI